LKGTIYVPQINRVHINDLLTQLLRHCPRVWAADAQLEERTGLWFLKQYCEQPFAHIKNSHQTLKRIVIEHDELNDWHQMMLKCMRQGKKIAVCSNSLKQAEKTYKFVETVIQNPIEWEIADDHVWNIKLMTGKTDKKSKQEFMRDKTKWKVDILIYSPFISSGVDYNEVNDTIQQMNK
jgi:hypothetical protein